MTPSGRMEVNIKDCPYCKEKMEVGYIPTAETLAQWIPDEERPSLIRFRYAKKSKKLIAENTLLGHRAKAFYSNNCGIVLLNEER